MTSRRFKWRGDYLTVKCPRECSITNAKIGFEKNNNNLKK
jgi:hypothetical protein